MKYNIGKEKVIWLKIWEIPALGVWPALKPWMDKQSFTSSDVKSTAGTWLYRNIYLVSKFKFNYRYFPV